MPDMNSGAEVFFDVRGRQAPITLRGHLNNVYRVWGCPFETGLAGLPGRHDRSYPCI
jgi:hypothetical protein